MIADLNDSDLTDITGENFVTSSIRNELVTKLERLQKALEAARQAAV